MMFKDEIEEEEAIKEEAIKEFLNMNAEQQDFLIRVNETINAKKYFFVGNVSSSFDIVDKLFSNYKEDSHIIMKFEPTFSNSRGFCISLEYIYEHIDSLKPIIEQKELKEIISGNNIESKKRGRL